VGISTGIIGSLFYRYTEQQTCLPAIFLGTLYWFFYGTAFVIGILEIIGGELQTGVIRFMAVSVKTYVLALGSTFGMKMVLVDSLGAWQQSGYCSTLDLNEKWWRIPLYLLCSASTLGQYRFPIVHYWRGLAVQLVGYVVQYDVLIYLADKINQNSNLDTACANVLAAMASVVAASFLSSVIDRMNYYYNARLLQRQHENFSLFGEFMYKLSAGIIRISNCIKLGRKSDVEFLDMKEKFDRETKELNDPTCPRTEIRLDVEEERILVQAIVGAENLSVWSLLMPTVYQLVPGSLIAKLWFNSIFPVPLLDGVPDTAKEAVFADLMVTATSLALGLLLGWGLNSILAVVIDTCISGVSKDRTDSTRGRLKRQKGRNQLLQEFAEDDPNSGEESSEYESVSNGSMDMDTPNQVALESVDEKEVEDNSPTNGFKTIGGP